MNSKFPNSGITESDIQDLLALVKLCRQCDQYQLAQANANFCMHLGICETTDIYKQLICSLSYTAWSQECILLVVLEKKDSYIPMVLNVLKIQSIVGSYSKTQFSNISFAHTLYPDQLEISLEYANALYYYDGEYKSILDRISLSIPILSTNLKLNLYFQIARYQISTSEYESALVYINSALNLGLSPADQIHVWLYFHRRIANLALLKWEEHKTDTLIAHRLLCSLKLEPRFIDLFGLEENINKKLTN